MKRTYTAAAQLLIMLCGMGFLLQTDAYYTPYLLVAAAALFCMWKSGAAAGGVGVMETGASAGARKDGKPRAALPWHVYAAPCIYALAVCGANYRIWAEIAYPDEIDATARFIHGAVALLAIAACCWLQAFQIVRYLWLTNAPEARGNAFSTVKDEAVCGAAGSSGKNAAGEETAAAAGGRRGWKPASVFCVVFAAVAVIDLTIFFLCRYPGNITSDSLTQIKMCVEGWYNNHHPFYHTQVIRLFLGLGLKLFGDLNAAAATYQVFQILFMAACFAAAVMTLFQMRVKKPVIIGAALFYALMPFHINYSFSMWKDVMFGGFILLFVLYFCRTMLGVGSRRADLALLTVACFGVCLFRSNGYILFLVVAAVYAFLYRKEILRGNTARAVGIIFLVTLAACWVLKHPVLDAMDVTQPDTVEMLSVPLQQISRTLIEHDDLTEEEETLIGYVIPAQRMRETYVQIYSDPVKNLIREEGQQDYIKHHKAAFAKLYIALGLRHPGSYLKGWADETRGYWNSGYEYWRWQDDVTATEGYDLYRTVRSEFAARHFGEYLWLFEHDPLTVLFLCIGLYVWLDWLLFYLAAVRGDRAAVVMTMPVIALVFTLQISTPVFTEFRYVYSIFCLMPFLLPAVIRGCECAHCVADPSGGSSEEPSEETAG